jgi:hypothetical protein
MKIADLKQDTPSFPTATTSVRDSTISHECQFNGKDGFRPLPVVAFSGRRPPKRHNHAACFEINLRFIRK